MLEPSSPSSPTAPTASVWRPVPLASEVVRCMVAEWLMVTVGSMWTLLLLLLPLVDLASEFRNPGLEFSVFGHGDWCSSP